MLRIREMRPADIPFAARLTNMENWEIPQSDFARILRLDGRGSFVATVGRRRVGLVTTAHYGRRIAWIGNVVVKREYRKRHIGQQLVDRAVNYLIKNHAKHVALYCFKENVQFYRKLGFVQGARFVRLRREPKPFLSKLPVEAPFQPLNLPSVLAIDRKGFGADRHQLIRSLLNEGLAWYLSCHGASSASYLLVKNYEDMNEIGPWVSFGLNSGELNLLLQLVINKSARKPIEIACPIDSRALKILKKNGFHPTNEGRAMYFKHVARIGRPRAIVAHGFLDKG